MQKKKRNNFAKQMFCFQLHLKLKQKTKQNKNVKIIWKIMQKFIKYTEKKTTKPKRMALKNI